MYKIMLRQVPATRLDKEMWSELMNPDETPWTTDSVDELDEKLKETLLNVSKNNIKVITEVDWELLIKHPEPAPDPDPNPEPTPPEESGGTGTEGGGTETGGVTE